MTEELEVKKENKSLLSVYINEELQNWIENEASNERRSRSGMVVYLLEEARRVREHNRAAMMRQG